MKNAEELPKNFAAMVDDECIERKQCSSVADPDPDEGGHSRVAPEQVALGGRDGKFLSCLKVPGVTGYLIAC